MQSHQNGVSSSTSSVKNNDHTWGARAPIKLPPKNIVINKNTLTELKASKKIRDLTIAQNKTDQQRVDLEVILSGFPVKPDVDVAVKKFLELFNASMNDIKSLYHFESRVNVSGSVSKVIHHVVVSFKEKSTKLKFLTTKTEKKCLVRFSQLTEQPSSQGQSNPSITCLNRLTKFNLNVERQLQRLLSQGIIEEFKLTGLLHEFRHNHCSTWILVTHLEMLKPLNDLLPTKAQMFQT